MSDDDQQAKHNNDETTTAPEQESENGHTADPGQTVQFSIVFDDADEVTDVTAPVPSSAVSSVIPTSVSETPDASPEETERTDHAAGDDAGTIAAPSGTDDRTAEQTADPNATHADTASENDIMGSDATRHIASHLDHELESRQEDDILLKSYPTFALDHVTLRDHKSGHAVLDDVQLSFYTRKLYAIITEDDDQRRALLSVLSGFRRPDKGQVMLKSVDLATLLPNEIRGHRIGLVPQRFALRDDLDATANIVYTMDSIDRTFLKPKPVLAHELLSLVGFTEAATGETIGQFDALDQRRIAIARAMACEPTALVIDAPTDGLDDQERATILRLLATLAHTGETARCVIMVTTSDEDIDAADRYFEL